MLSGRCPAGPGSLKRPGPGTATSKVADLVVLDLEAVPAARPPQFGESDTTRSTGAGLAAAPLAVARTQGPFSRIRRHRPTGRLVGRRTGDGLGGGRCVRPAPTRADSTPAGEGLIDPGEALGRPSLGRASNRASIASNRSRTAFWNSPSVISHPSSRSARRGSAASLDGTVRLRRRPRAAAGRT